MSTKPKNAGPHPAPIFKKRKWLIPLIWVIPLGAAVAAGFYWYDSLQDRGPQITITFDDITSLKSDNTPIQRNGVVIGQVIGAQLAADNRHVLVHARLQRDQSIFATKGAMYWIVRPDISGGSISGLGTVVSGPYIEALPGTGDQQLEFTGFDKPPVALGSGLHVTLYADRLEHLSSNSPVYYKGIQVGSVQDIEITDDARLVRFSLFIEHRFTPLVRANTNFWIVPGIDVKGGLFSGLKLELGPLRALLAGGIEFATPDTKGTPAKDGAEYPLFDEPKDAWTTWGPQIPLLPADGEESATTHESQQEPNSLQKTLQGKQ